MGCMLVPWYKYAQDIVLPVLFIFVHCRQYKGLLFKARQVFLVCLFFKYIYITPLRQKAVRHALEGYRIENKNKN